MKFLAILVSTITILFAVTYVADAGCGGGACALPAPAACAPVTIDVNATYAVQRTVKREVVKQRLTTAVATPIMAEKAVLKVRPVRDVGKVLANGHQRRAERRAARKDTP